MQSSKIDQLLYYKVLWFKLRRCSALSYLVTARFADSPVILQVPKLEDKKSKRSTKKSNLYAIGTYGKNQGLCICRPSKIVLARFDLSPIYQFQQRNNIRETIIKFYQIIL